MLNFDTPVTWSILSGSYGVHTQLSAETVATVTMNNSLKKKVEVVFI